MRILATFIFLLIASPLAAEAPSQPPILSFDQILEIRSRARLCNLAIECTDALTQLLKSATDQPSAQRIAPAAERLFLQLQALHARTDMLPLADASEHGQLKAMAPRWEQSRKELSDECERIAPALTYHHPLVPIMVPFRKAIWRETEGRRLNVISTLETLRIQIELYKLQHRDKLPDFRKYGWEQLTRKTHPDGTPDDAGKFGPYLQSAPRSDLNDSSKILITRTAPKPDFKYADNDCGFIIDEVSGKIWALDAEGRIFNE